MSCLRSARYNQIATVVKAGEGSTGGYFREEQDPITGGVKRVWVPGTAGTPGESFDIPCMARGIIDGGIRVAGTTERFSDIIESADWVKMVFSPDALVTKRDQIVNIRDASTGQVIWQEEEFAAHEGTVRPTRFNVNGVTPIVDPLLGHVENLALLERAEEQ